MLNIFISSLDLEMLPLSATSMFRNILVSMYIDKQSENILNIPLASNQI